VFNHQYFSAQYFPPVWFAPGDESHLLPHETMGMSEFEVDFADDPKPRKPREVSIEPMLQKALRLRNEAKAEFSSSKQKRKAKQLVIKSAREALSDNIDSDIQSSVLSDYLEWLSYQPLIIEIESDGESAAYQAFLAEIGRMINQWQEDDEEAVLALIL
jgi:hypothetical protein